MYIESILKTIKDSPELQDLLNIKGEREEDFIEDKEDFYKPGYYELDEEYKKYKQILQKEETDKTIFFRIGRINHYWENHSEAIKYYEKALEIDVDYGEAHYNIGNIYFRQNNLEKSKYHYLKAIEANPGDIYALNALAQTYLRLKEFEEALKYHREALDHNPKDLYALRGTGNIYLVMQNFGEALNYYYKALEINPFDGFTLYDIGLLHILSGKITKAKEHFEENMEKSNFFGFQLGLGLCCYKLGEKEEAFNHYKNGITRDYGTNLDIIFSLKSEDEYWNKISSEVHFCKGNAYYAINNLAKAIEELNIAININPLFFEAHRLVGKLYFERGDYSSAIKHYEVCLEGKEDNLELEKEVCQLQLSLTPDNPEYLKKLDHIYWLREDFKEEIEILDKITELIDDPLYIYRLGEACLFYGLRVKAKENFDRLLSLKGKKSLAYRGLAGFYLVKNDYKEALAFIKKALRSAKSGEYYVEAGKIYERLDENKKAADSFLEALKLEPYSKIIHKFFLDSLFSGEKAEIFPEALDICKSFPSYNLLLALFYMRKRDSDSARKMLLKVELTEENRDLFHLYNGICYGEEGYLERALNEFENISSSEEFKGERCGRMALIYGELGNEDKVKEMVIEANNYIRFISPVLRYKLCVLMWKFEIKELLEDFLGKTLWSINFHNHIVNRNQKEIAVKELNEIRKSFSLELENEKKARSEVKDAEEDELKLKPEYTVTLETVYPVSLELGRGLLPLIDPNQGGRLLERITSIRKHIAAEMGVIVPPFRFKNNLQLKPGGYIIKVKNVEVAGGEVVPGRFLAIGPEKYLKPLKGPKCFDATYDMPAVWIAQDQRGKAEKLGCMIFEPVNVMTVQITEVVKCYACELLGRQEVKSLLDTVAITHPDVVGEIYPKIFTLGEIQNVLENLLIEKVSIRDLVTILESLGDYAHISKDTDLLTEFVRQNLSSAICREYQDEESRITVITLEPEVENIIMEAIKKTEFGSFLSLDRDIEKVILTALGEHIKVMEDNGIQPIVLCSANIRRYLKRLTEKVFSTLVVLSYNEIAPRVTVNTIGTVSVPTELKTRSRKKNLFLYHAEKMCLDPDSFVRCEGIKSLASVAERENLEKVFSYLDAGLKDEDEKVRHESAKVIRELCSKKAHLS